MTAAPDPRLVFVVHGRDHHLRDQMYAFLRAIDLKPLEFSAATLATGKAAPYIGEALQSAFSTAQAVVVLFTPDEEARLLPHLAHPEDPPHERELTAQARPNVLFEAGMALASQPDRTVLVEIGSLRPFSDLAGRHLIRLTNDTTRRQELAQRLQVAGCAVDLSTVAWHNAGDFRVLVPATPHENGFEQSPVTDADKAGATGVGHELSETEVNVLVTLSRERTEDLRSKDVASSLGISDELAWYHLERLRDAHYVTQIINMYTGPRWAPSKKGREALYRRGLLA